MGTLSDPRITVGLLLAVLLAATWQELPPLEVRSLAVTRAPGREAPPLEPRAEAAADLGGDLEVLVGQLESAAVATPERARPLWSAVEARLRAQRTVPDPAARLALLDVCLRIADLRSQLLPTAGPGSTPTWWPLDLRAILQVYEHDVRGGPDGSPDPRRRRAQDLGLTRLAQAIPETSPLASTLARLRARVRQSSRGGGR